MTPEHFSPKITSGKLNENLYKTYGVKINFNDYDRSALEDIRNKIRTQISQLESKSLFNDLLENDEYQKGKMILGIINQKLKEMVGESRKIVKEKAVSKKQQQAAGIALKAKQEGKKPKGKGAAAEMAKMSTKELEKFASTPHKGLPEKKQKKVSEDKNTDEIDKKIRQARKKLTARGEEVARTLSNYKAGQLPEKNKSPTSEGKKSKPDFLDLDGDGNKKEPMKSAAKEKKSAKTKMKSTQENPQLSKKRPSKKTVNESYRRHAMKVNESVSRLLNEDEEGKAKDITAAADMVNDFTGWMQRVGQYQTKSMIELADSIRSNFGQAEAETFKSSVQPALETALEALTQSREQITKAVAVLAGEEDASTMIGPEPNELDTNSLEEPDMDIEEPDNFSASDAAAGGAEVSGRELRESQLIKKARQIAESNNLIRKLAGK